MGWASAYLEPLQRGETVSFRPRGNSMVPLIRSGQLCTVAPLGERTLEKGDIVLCRVGGAQYLHRILAVGADGRYQIGNNRGGINGWIGREQIYGRLLRVET